MESTNWQDLLNQAGEAGKPPAATDHLVRVEHAEFKRASTGKKMWKLRMKIIAGPDTNKTVYDQLVLTEDNPNALNMFFNKVRAIGVDPAMFAGLGDEQIAQLFIGKQVIVTVKTDRIYNNAVQVDVENYAPAGAGVPTAAAAPAAPPAPAPAPPPVAPAQTVPPAPAAQSAAAPPEPAPASPQGSEPAPAPAPAVPEVPAPAPAAAAPTPPPRPF